VKSKERKDRTNAFQRKDQRRKKKLVGSAFKFNFNPYWRRRQVEEEGYMTVNQNYALKVKNTKRWRGSPGRDTSRRKETRRREREIQSNSSFPKNRRRYSEVGPRRKSVREREGGG